VVLPNRALYAAKAKGRNRVEIIDSRTEHQPQDA